MYIILLKIIFLKTYCCYYNLLYCVDYKFLKQNINILNKSSKQGIDNGTKVKFITNPVNNLIRIQKKKRINITTRTKVNRIIIILINIRTSLITAKRWKSHMLIKKVSIIRNIIIIGSTENQTQSRSNKRINKIFHP